MIFLCVVCFTVWLDSAGLLLGQPEDLVGEAQKSQKWMLKPQSAAKELWENNIKDITDPMWLNDTFFKDILRSMANNQEEGKVVKWSCCPAVAPGSNYLSQLYRVKVEYKMGHEDGIHLASLIVKIPLESGKVREFVDAIDGYSKEVQMYRDVLPRMYELLNCRVTARSFKCFLDKSLVLEDLQVQGYKMGDRLKQLDLNHCKQFLLSLSIFHALSIALNNRDPQLIQTVGKQMFFLADSADRERQENFFKFGLHAMVATIKTLPGCEHYAEIINNRIDSYYDIMVKIFNPTGKFNVLNHGDTWTNNILFKYSDSGEVVDAKLVDLQMCRYCTFTHDVIYFWWTSANDYVREHHREEMFEFYRQNLNQRLQELGCSDILSKEGFDSELKASAPFSISVISGILNAVMADPDDLMDFNDLDVDDMAKPVDQNSKQAKNYHSKYYKAVLPNILRQAELFGVFD